MTGCFANMSSYQGPILRIVSTTKRRVKPSPSWILYSSVLKYNILGTILCKSVNSEKASIILGCIAWLASYIIISLRKNSLKSLLREQINLMEDKTKKRLVSTEEMINWASRCLCFPLITGPSTFKGFQPRGWGSVSCWVMASEKEMTSDLMSALSSH